MAQMDEDDPVVEEMTVYLAKTLQKKLYIFQYPVKPVDSFAGDQLAYKSARIKPLHQKVEIELSLDTRSSTYDKTKGEQLASQVNTTKDDTPFFSSTEMDKMVLNSTRAVLNTTPYAVACFKNEELHINPVHGILQLRPDFAYIDRIDSKSRSANKEPEAVTAADDDDDAQAINVKFAGAQKEKQKKNYIQSFSNKEKTLLEEKWIGVDLINNNSEMSCLERRYLLCQQINETPSSNVEVSNECYLKVLLPQEDDSKSLQVDLSDRIRDIFVNAKIINFLELLSLLPQKINVNKMLRAVQDVAVLVQGCWVVKSDLLYSTNACSPHSGIESEVLIRGRDYIMWMFTKSRNLNRKEMSTMTKLPREDLKDIFGHMARWHTINGWEFMLPSDSDFIEKYPDIVQRQQNLWNKKSQQLIKLLKINKESPIKKIMPEVRSPRQRRRNKSQRESDSENSGSEFRMNEKADREIKIKCEAMEHPLTNGHFNAIDVNSEFVPPSEALEELERFVREKLQEHLCVSLSDLRRLLKHKLAASPPGHILSKLMSDQLLCRAAEQAGASLIKTQWPNDRQEEPLYAITKMDDDLDPWRKVLFELFQSNSRYKKTTILKKIKEVTAADVLDSDLVKLLKDYCISTRNGIYYLKGTYKPNS